ncbi:MAG: nucleotidyltransferase substrate binding protein [Rhodospirillales bacterium]|nr:nucleotidyltransferase substrate binding protein [Rhodospirillales bacterium]
MGERWKQRFENFEKAYLLLKEVVDAGIADFSDLEQEGVVQRYEYTFELAWKVMKDFMEYQGVQIENSFPRSIIKQGFQAGLIKDVVPWGIMLKDRNILSHRYDETVFRDALARIENMHMSEFSALYEYLKGQRDG